MSLFLGPPTNVQQQKILDGTSIGRCCSYLLTRRGFHKYTVRQIYLHTFPCELSPNRYFERRYFDQSMTTRHYIHSLLGTGGRDVLSQVFPLSFG